MEPDTLKVLFDIGFGAFSLVLWLQQRKVNALQVGLDAKQSQATADLAAIVQNHERRLRRLERARRRRGST